MFDLKWLELRLRARLEALRLDSELEALASTFRGARALEIGGPSILFYSGGRFPMYRFVGELDAANYASSTLWDSSARWEEGIRPSRLFVLEATDLASIDTGTYDAVLTSHVIEHLADPVGALEEWHRVLRPGGRLVIVAPHKDGTFDHLRPVTPLEHLVADNMARTPESDLTHLHEVLSLHDLSRDPLAGDREAFGARCGANATHRAMHHHVFDAQRLMEAVETAGLSVTHLACRRPYHIVVVASGEPAVRLSKDDLIWALASSPFTSDRSFAPSIARR
jgi:SAM-dependent methyltransferase